MRKITFQRKKLQKKSLKKNPLKMRLRRSLKFQTYTFQTPQKCNEEVLVWKPKKHQHNITRKH